MRGEFVGCIRVLKRLKAVCDGNGVDFPFVTHDECATADLFVKIVSGKDDRSVLDGWHKETKVKADFKKELAAAKIWCTPACADLAATILRDHFRSASHQERGHRLLYWNNFDFEMYGVDEAIVSHVKDFVMDVFIPAYSKYAASMDKVDNPSTSMVESFHSHSRMFWSKRLYQVESFPIRVMCATLSWNREKNWLVRLVEAVEKKLQPRYTSTT